MEFLTSSVSAPCLIMRTSLMHDPFKVFNCKEN